MNSALQVVKTEHTDLNDQHTFKSLYEEYFPKVYNYIRIRVTEQDTADDLTSRVFHKMLDHRKSFDPAHASFATWLFTITRNTINDHLRRKRHRDMLPLMWLRNWISPEPGPDPEQVAIDTEEREFLLAAIAQLGHRERDVLGLRYFAGQSYDAIAEVTGLSKNNVGVIIHRALQNLQSVLQTQEKKS